MAVGIVFLPLRSLQHEIRCGHTDKHIDQHTDQVARVTLAAHAHRGLILLPQLICCTLCTTCNQIIEYWMLHTHCTSSHTSWT